MFQLLLDKKNCACMCRCTISKQKTRKSKNPKSVKREFAWDLHAGQVTNRTHGKQLWINREYLRVPHEHAMCAKSSIFSGFLGDQNDWSLNANSMPLYEPSFFVRTKKYFHKTRGDYSTRTPFFFAPALLWCPCLQWKVRCDWAWFCVMQFSYCVVEFSGRKVVWCAQYCTAPVVYQPLLNLSTDVCLIDDEDFVDCFFNLYTWYIGRASFV